MRKQSCQAESVGVKFQSLVSALPFGERRRVNRQFRHQHCFSGASARQSLRQQEPGSPGRAPLCQVDEEASVVITAVRKSITLPWASVVCTLQESGSIFLVQTAVDFSAHSSVSSMFVNLEMRHRMPIPSHGPWEVQTRACHCFSHLLTEPIFYGKLDHQVVKFLIMGHAHTFREFYLSFPINLEEWCQ